MKKLAFLLGIFSIILFTGIASAKLCYQENATQSSSCGGVSGGSYTADSTPPWGNCISNMYDGNWSTGCISFDHAYFYPTYVIPPNITGSQNITAACNDIVVFGGLPIWKFNVTVPSVCMNHSTGNLSIRWYSRWYGSAGVGYWNTSTLYCKTYDNNWLSVAVFGNNTNADCSDPVEEAMWWNFADDTTPPNLTIYSPQNTTYNTINISLAVSANENISNWWYSLNGVANTTFIPNTTITGKQGNNNITVYANDTAGNIGNSTVFFSINAINFVSQSPSDINTLNLFGKTVNITYNIGFVPNSPQIYYKTNTSAEDCWLYINGVQSICGWLNRSVQSNVTDNYTFALYDNQVYPAIYNFDEYTIEQTPHSVYTFIGHDHYVKIRFFNISSIKQYSQFEIMTNDSSSLTSLGIYYCNDSYTTGDPDLSNNCVKFYDLLGDVPYNHTHSAYSSHMLIPFAIDNMTGLVNGIVLATATSYFLLRGNTSAWNAYYIANDTGTAEITTDNGTTWTNLNGTVDAHLHQYDGTDSIWYYIYACDYSGNCGNSTERQDLLQTGGLHPTAPDVFYPKNLTYRGDMLINYTISVSPNLVEIASYNISLLNQDNSFNMTLADNNSPNLTYMLNSTALPDGGYRIKVEGCDINGLCSFGLSLRFSIDNTLPVVAIFSPTNTSYNVMSIPLQVSAGEAVSIWKYSLNGGANVTFVPNNTVTAIQGNNNISVYAIDVAGNTGNASVFFFVAIPEERPIDNLGLFSGVALILMGAGVLLLLMEAFFGNASEMLRDPKKLAMVILGALIIVAMLGSLL